VNLQAPLAESPLGYDTTDWQLDLWIPEGGEAEWKDEEDLARALELGLMTPDEGRLAREEAERVLEEWPFPTGWEDWQPNPAWPLPTLPEGWDVV
jgi:predicted RNA-binding protein associated with RNAse of E/G family